MVRHVNVSQRQSGIGRPGDRHVVQSPLVAQRAGSHGSNGKHRVVAALNTLSDRCIRDGRGFHNGERRDAAVCGPVDIGSHKRVTAGVSQCHRRDRQRVAVCARERAGVKQVGAILLPLICEGRRARNGGCERGIATDRNRLIRRLHTESRRISDGQSRDTACDRAERIVHHDVVVAGVGRSN